MKWLRRGLVVVLSLVVLAMLGGAALFWLLSSERGTSLIAAQLTAAAPALTIARVRGSLLETIVLEDVRWRSERDELDIAELTLEWNAPALLAGVLSLDQARATRAAYRRVPGPAAPPRVPTELPWPVHIAEGAVSDLTVTIADRPVSFSATRFSGTLAGGRLTIDELTTRAGALDLAGRAAIGLQNVAMDLAVDWTAPFAGMSAQGHAELAGTWPELVLRHELTAPFPATTEGSVDFGGDAPGFDLTTEWQDLAWPGSTVVTSPTGRLTVAGTYADYRYESTGSLVAAGRASGFSARGTAQRLELAVERLELTPEVSSIPAGRLQGEGTASLTALSTELAITADAFDPRWIAAQWPGRLNGTTMLRAALRPVLQTAFDAANLTGELRGYPITLRGDAAYESPGRWSFDALRLESQASRFVIDGMLDATTVDIAVDAELATLDLLAPGVAGALRGEATITGTWREPRARGELSATGLRAAGVAIDRLDARGEIGLASDTRAAVTIEAAGITRGPVVVERVAAAVSGTTRAHTASITAEAEGWDAELETTGSYDAGRWRGTLERLDIDERILGPWQLEERAELALERGAAELATACLVHVSRARWCTALDVRGRPEDRVVFSGQNVELATLRPLLPPEITIEGVYQLSASLFDPTGEPRGALALTGDTTRARVAFGTEQAFETELTQVRAGATLTDRRLELRATLATTGGSSAELAAAVADVRAADSGVTGSVRAQWSDVGFLTLLTPDLDEIAGRLAVDLGVGGTVAEPTVEGRAQLDGGRLTVPRWGLVIEGIEAAATSDDGRALAIDATGRVGESQLTLAGRTALDPTNGWPTRLTLRGEAVPILQRTDMSLVATPDLTIDVALPRVTVTGGVHIPTARVAIEELPAQAVAPSPDAVLHGVAAPPTPNQPILLSTAIELTLGEDVRYRGLNLDTEVDGRLRLETEPNRSAAASGTLNLEGNYVAYGQSLELERGQLQFSGPLDNPGLDVSAIREVDAVRVGVELTGTLREPRTRVFSTPAMSEADALSYLLFGRPATTADSAGDDNSTLEAAALALGLQQALPGIQRFGSSLGLDELSVQSTSTDAGALMAGKYLSPKVYVRYSYGLFNRIGGLLLRFRVNDRFSIETNSGEQNSMDLLITVEKD
jgi:translocation and assembly module TamB